MMCIKYVSISKYLRIRIITNKYIVYNNKQLKANRLFSFRKYKLVTTIVQTVLNNKYEL